MAQAEIGSAPFLLGVFSVFYGGTGKVKGSGQQCPTYAGGVKSPHPSRQERD